MIKKIVLSLLLITTTFLNLFSLSPEKNVDSFIFNCYDSSSGMPQNSANAFAENSKGFVYIATQEGIIKYDGYEMDVFDISNLAKLHSSNIRDIKVMSNDSVFVATSKGLTHYSSSAEVIDDFKKHPFIEGSDIKSIALSEDNSKLYGAVSGKGIFLLKTGTPPFFFRIHDELKGLQHINKLFISKSNELYIGARTGLYKFINQKIEKIYNINDDILDISGDIEGAVWAAGSSALYKIDTNGKITKYDEKNGLLLNNLSAVMVDSKNTVWIGSGKQGIARFANNQFIHARNGNHNKLRNITAFFEDKEGNIWTGTKTDGFCIVKDGIVKDVLLKDKMIINISGDSKGNIWANTDGYGVAKITPEGLKSFHTERIGPFLLSVFADSKDRIWVSSRNNGLFVSGKNNGFVPIEEFFKGKSGIKPLNTSVFFEDSRNTIWFNGRDNPSKIFYISKETLSFYELPAKDASIVDIKENRAGEIIAGTRNNGIFKLDPVTGEFIKLTVFPENIFAHNLTIDSKNRLWVSTHNDGLLISVKGDILTLNREKGLFDQTIHAITEDKTGGYWLTTNKGLFTISSRSIENFINGNSSFVTSTVFYESDGLPSRECNGGVQPSVYKSDSGLLYFPTIQGAFSIDPSQIFSLTATPELSVSWIIFDDKRENRKRYIDGETVMVPPGTKSMEILYAAPSFSSPSKIRFDYRLNNIISVRETQRRFATFNNLDPGEYEFNIRSYFYGSSGNYSEKTLKFNIQPYFYQTKNFKISSISVLLLLITLIWLMRKRSALAKEEEMLRIINEKTYELQMKNNELEEVIMIDPLTNLKNRRYLFEIEEHNIENFINSKERLTHLSENRDAALKSNLTYAVIMLDIDHFKQINDHFGHNTGDLVLIDFAQILQNNIRKEDVVIRWGGEEFVIILKDVKKEKVPDIAEKIRKAVESFAFRTETGQTIWITTSLGISMIPFYPQSPNLMSFESVLSITDLALYNSKNKGRDTCTMVIPGKRIPSSQEHLHGMLANAHYADLNNFYTFERIKPDNFGEYEI